jgi:hypothetical protein
MEIVIIVSYFEKKSVELNKGRGIFTLTLAFPFKLKSILRQKKNYGNSNISPCKNITF